MRNIAFFGSTGPSARSNFCTRAVTSVTSCSNSSRSTSYAGLFQANHGRLLFFSSPPRNSRSALRCMPRFDESDCGSAADVAHLDLGQRLRPFRAALGIAVPALRPDRGKIVGDCVVGAAAAQERAQIVALGREEAGIELAVGRQARARAVAAKRLRDRGDHTDLTRAGTAGFQIAPALGNLAPIVRIRWLERKFAPDDANDFCRRD